MGSDCELNVRIVSLIFLMVTDVICVTQQLYFFVINSISDTRAIIYEDCLHSNITLSHRSYLNNLIRWIYLVGQ